MNTYRNLSVPLVEQVTGEQCVVTAFLKNIFGRCKGAQRDAGVIIYNTIAEASGAIARINTHVPRELCVPHLMAVEKAMTDAEFRYVIVSRNDRPAMFLYFQLFPVSSASFTQKTKTSLASTTVGLLLDVRRARVLVAGNALRIDAPAMCYDATMVSPSEALDALVSVANRLADSGNIVTTILPGFPDAGNADRKMLAAMGYTAPWIDTVMEMKVDPAWKTLNDYANSLSRKYKARFNKIMNSMSDIEVRSLSVAEMKQYEPRMEQLFLEVVEKQSFTLSRCGASLLTAMKDICGTDFEVYGYFLQGELIGFCSGIISATAYEVWYVGFSSEVNTRYPLYFHMLFHGLGRAIELGLPLLKLGRTSFDAKASLGAKPADTGYTVRVRYVPDVAVNWVLRYLAATEDNKWKQRSPLKAAAVAAE